MLLSGHGCFFVGLWRWFGVEQAPLAVPLLEVLLADAARRAGPVFGDVFECRARSDAAFRVAFCRIIDVSADDAYILIHISCL